MSTLKHFLTQEQVCRRAWQLWSDLVGVRLRKKSLLTDAKPLDVISDRRNGRHAICRNGTADVKYYSTDENAIKEI